MPFPEGYNGSMDNTWKGFYIEKFSIILPKAFKKDEANNTSSSLDAADVLIDPSGFTGDVSWQKTALNAGNNNKFKAEKWDFDINLIKLTFLQNNFKAGSIGGQLSIPVTDEADEMNGVSGRISFIGVIEDQDTYGIQVAIDKNLNLPMRALRSNAVLYAGSWIKLEHAIDAQNIERFYPSCNLSGELEFVGKIEQGKEKVAGEESVNSVENLKPDGTAAESSPALTDPDDATNNFKGIKFQGMYFKTADIVNKIATPNFAFGIDNFAYENNNESKVGNFPVSISKVAKFTGTFNGKSPDAKDLWIDFGFRININENINGSSNIIIKTKYDQNKGRLRYQGISLKTIEVHGQSSAFSLDGLIDIYDCTAGKGFKGKLDLVLFKPSKMEFCASANFGYDKIGKFRYGYVDGFMQADKLGVPLFPPSTSMLINGGGIGLYFNMKPEWASTATVNCTTTANTCDASQMFVYKTNNTIPLGAKVILSLTNSSGSFNARGSLDFAFSTKTGIDHIALTGVGTIGEPKATGTVATNELKEEGRVELQSASSNLDNSASASNNNTTDLLKKASDKSASRPGGTFSNAAIAFDFGMMLDFPSKTLHSELAVWINKGDLRGIGPNGLVGRAVLHADPTDFYLHVGKATKNQRIGLKYGNDIRMDAYVMIGSGIPPFPAPPNRVIQYLDLDRTKFGPTAPDYASNQVALKEGSGIAVGASLSIYKRIEINNKWSVKAAVDAGFDVMLRNNAKNCRPQGGFFFNGQLYGYGEFGVYRKEEKKANVALGVYLFASGMGPFGATGVVKFRPPFIGFLTGDIKAGFEIGQPCVIN
jgi:hypothetical protein